MKTINIKGQIFKLKIKEQIYSLEQKTYFKP